MDEKLKRDIYACIRCIRERGFTGEIAAAFAAGWLSEYQEIAELMDAIAGGEEDD